MKPKDAKFWDEMEADNQVFKNPRISYIPALDTKRVMRRPKSRRRPTEADIVQMPPFDPADKKIYHYLHAIELTGWFNNNTKFPRIKGLSGPHMMKPDRKDIRTDTAYQNKVGYFGADQTTLLVYWFKDNWEQQDRKTRGYKRKASIKVVLKPPFRKGLWDGVLWAQQIVERIERGHTDKYYQHQGLWLSKIETPLDWAGDIDKPTMTRLYWRSHSKILWASRSSDSDEKVTVYDGGRSYRRQARIYPKAGCWHLEPVIEQKALRSARLNRLNIPTVLRILIWVYESIRFRTLDIKRVIRSKAMQGEVLATWDAFVHYGLKSAAKYIKTRSFDYPGVRNYLRYCPIFKPLDSFLKETQTAVIAEGIQILAETGESLPIWLTADSVREQIQKRAFRIEVKKSLKRMG